MLNNQLNRTNEKDEEVVDVEVEKHPPLAKKQKIGFNYEVSGENVSYSDFKDKVNELVKIVGKNSDVGVNFSLNVSSSDE